MQTLQIFNFSKDEVRTIVINDEPYFVGNDVARVLGYEKPSTALCWQTMDFVYETYVEWLYEIRNGKYSYIRRKL